VFEKIHDHFLRARIASIIRNACRVAATS
jgi:hypothetical protein